MLEPKLEHVKHKKPTKKRKRGKKKAQSTIQVSAPLHKWDDEAEKENDQTAPNSSTKSRKRSKKVLCHNQQAQKAGSPPKATSPQQPTRTRSIDSKIATISTEGDHATSTTDRKIAAATTKDQIIAAPLSTRPRRLKIKKPKKIRGDS